MKTSSIVMAVALLSLVHVVSSTIRNSTNDGVSPCFSDQCKESKLFGESGRTFGVGPRKRMAMFFLPIMFKLGVIMTLLVGLTVMTAKGLTIGVILLIFAFTTFFSKLKAQKVHGIGPPSGPVHLHVHDFENSRYPPSYSYPPSYPYSYGDPYDRIDEEPPEPSFWEKYLGRSSTF